jgi:hypothetical protein
MNMSAGKAFHSHERTMVAHCAEGKAIMDGSHLTCRKQDFPIACDYRLVSRFIFYWRGRTGMFTMFDACATSPSIAAPV